MKLSRSSVVTGLACIVALAAAERIHEQERQLHIGKWTLNGL